MRIDDATLISWLKDNFKDIGFISQLKLASPERKKQLSSNIASLNNGSPLHKQKETILRIWKNLVEYAIVYLKSEDAREKFHDDAAYGVERLSRFFETFISFEGLLYGAEEERYRDHMSHMFAVFLLGEYLIKKRITFEKIDVGDKDLPEGEKIKPDEKEAMWCIMSLTHDLGYALQTIPSISEKATDMLGEFGITNIQGLSYGFPSQPLHDFMIRLISSDLQKLSRPDTEDFFTPHIQSKYFLKFSEAFERRDHGVVSCLVLMKNLVFLLETDFLLDSYKPFDLRDARQYLIRRNILRPIASHSCEDIYYHTLPEFGFLLTIFDEMHEWNRPRFADLFKATHPETVLIVELLNDSEIHYKVEFQPLSKEEQKRAKKAAQEYFLQKCTKIMRILRSAVAEADCPRKLKLTFEVSDRIGSKIEDYKIIHKTPQDVKVFKNNHEISWGKFKNRKENER